MSKGSKTVDGDTLDYSTAVNGEGRHQPVTDPNDFHKSATEILQKLATSVEAMRIRDDPLKVDLSKHHGILTVDLGGEVRISLKIDEKYKCISMTSPHSGAYNYYLCQVTGKFLGIDHHHSLEGTFTRDLLQICAGLPEL